MIIRVLLAVVVCVSSFGAWAGYEPRDGDVIFHTSRSAQSLAVQAVTRSPYSHMGIVYILDGKPVVYEAVEPVKLTPLDVWIERGEGGRFVAKRLVDAERLLTPEALERMHEVGAEFAGKHYDLYFEWSDERIYCSELVWKIFKRALDIEVGALQTISEFDLSHPAVQVKISERWSDQPPAGELVISPAAMFESSLLVTVYANE
ncbi:hypothetical protein CK507_02505 [Pseudomonas sp. WN033]|nr:hypothetical protein CK507_02505 [Pseudomonas sp. WN033]